MRLRVGASCKRTAFHYVLFIVKKNDSPPTHRCMFVFQFFITNNIFIIKAIIITKRNYEPNC